MARRASCTCGALVVTAEGEPAKVSACHCVSCQKRTGSAFSVAVFYPIDRTAVAGISHCYVRRGDSGQDVAFHFCPTCASTLFWYPAFRPGWIGLAIGCFDDAAPPPTQAVYEQHRLDWVTLHVAST